MTNNKLIDFKKKLKIYDGRDLLCFDNRPNDFLEIFKDIVKKHPDNGFMFSRTI